MNRELIPLRAEADDAAHGDIREVRVVAEFLASEGVRQVQFDEGQLHAEQGVTQRDAGVSEAARVEDAEADAIRFGRLDAIDELMLGVALKRHELVPQVGRGGFRAFFDGGERVRAVHLGFALTQQVEIRAVE